MNILITGANGQLGGELVNLLPNAIATTSKDLDITKQKDVDRFVRKNNIETIINCAAYTNVDGAEKDVFNAFWVNSRGPKFLAQSGCNLIHISTDYVFDGNANVPYKTTDKVCPVSVYGRTKAIGEKAVLKYARVPVIIRTAWLYSQNGKNFFKTMQRLGTEKPEINVVNDQFGTPTFVADLASAIVQMLPQISESCSGVYHFTNMGQCSWYDFACEIMKKSGLKCKVNPISSSEYPTAAKRPMYSVLDKTKIIETFGLKIPDWRDALVRCINEKVR